MTALPPELRGVGMVFQNYALYPHLTVRQNILFPLENLKGKERPSKEEMNRRVTETAKLVQIEELMDRKPRELSGGQQQRVAIARALVKMPQGSSAGRAPVQPGREASASDEGGNPENPEGNRDHHGFCHP